MNDFKLSVVIPIYNAGDYVLQAVESALQQPETGEVILIEDGATDGGLEICRELDIKHPKVVLLRHPDGGNHGAGASRNLGIKNAKFQYIAFLDADDYFLPNRFFTTNKMFNKYSDIDGVYEAVGFHYEGNGVIRFKGQMNELTTMSEIVPPELLFEKQSPIGTSGYCNTDGWTVKKTIFEKTGYFDETLNFHEDTVLFVKFAALGKMLPGNLDKPVAMRRIHINRSMVNRTRKVEYDRELLMWESLWIWGRNNLSKQRQEIIQEKLIRCAASIRSQGIPNKFLLPFNLIKLFVRHPSLINSKYFKNKMLLKNNI